MKIKIKVQTIVPLISLVVGVFWVIYGVSSYGLWHPIRGPTMGLVPTLVASLLVVMSILGLFKSLKAKDEPERMENWAIVLAAWLAFSLVFILGMIVTLLIFVLVWLKFYEKVGWKNTIVSLVISFGIMYGVFYRWLLVPLPNGLIFNMIFG